MRLWVVALIIGIFLTGCAATPSPRTAWSNDTWIVSRTEDPITSVVRCVVSAPDRASFGAYSRTGYLYPFVERNSEAGLLVGVTSGGMVRIPPGDIQWRVDRLPHRTFQAANTPVVGEPTQFFDPFSMPPEAQAAFEASQAMTAGFLSSVQNGVTAVGAPEATQVLNEMRAGTELLFRATASAPAAGLPSSQTFAVGQLRDGAVRPILIDDSFHRSLKE